MTQSHLQRLPYPRRVIKSFLRQIAGSGTPPTIVASMGRSGSTVVYSTVVKAVARRAPLPQSLGRRVLADTAWDLSKARLRPGVVYKTHDLPRDDLAGTRARAIFVFGYASEAALSVLACQERYGEAWVEEHFAHLGSTHGNPMDLLQRDVLGFQRQIEEWLSPHPYPVVALRYDGIWESEGVLSKFLDVSISFPTREPRRPHGLPEEVEEAVRRTFKPLDDWIHTLPKFQIIQSTRI